ncbi:protein ANTAGONIST OF LIKE HETEROCHROMATIN PROTEIN 1-like [Tasmannia lanceolata]|uniref:protein ANTAGONIST OF LIKE HETEROCHROMATIN PROTEIN 1-like n=1 Tax=Tasmannia lanceolata TaxID=3420 RepID=UPI004063B0D5
MSLLPTEDDGNGDDGGMDFAIQGCALVAAGTAVALAAVMEEEQAFFECSPYENTYLTQRTFLPYALRSDERCHDLLQMNVECFTRFVHILKGTELLTDTLHCSVEEQLAIFLHIISHDLRNRCMKAYFRRSGETVSQYFSKVLDAIMSMSDLLIKPPSPDTPPQIRANRRLYPYFKNCIGAVDGTHIRAKVPFDTRGRFLGRKGWTSQNVLAACDFDLKFTFVKAGWEGSESNSRILGETLANERGIICHPGKYYLVDGGFPLLSHFITPFRKMRYHLNEFRSNMPWTAEELFNHRYSSARNVIERAFGVLKKRFAVLYGEPMYPFPKQVDLVIACCCIHNFIRGVMPRDGLVGAVDRELAVVADSELASTSRQSGRAEDEEELDEEELCREPWLSGAQDGIEGDRIRTEICSAMWRDYRPSA